MSLRDKREALGLTQEDVAERIGTSQSVYAQIESGKTKLTNADRRRAISQALGIRHVDFLVEVGELEDWEVPGFSASAPPPDPRLEQMDALLRRIDLDTDSRATTLSGILHLWAAQDQERSRPVPVRTGTR
jgi:transcriptional regulator with XRE-family HTH domain